MNTNWNADDAIQMVLECADRNHVNVHKFGNRGRTDRIVFRDGKPVSGLEKPEVSCSFTFGEGYDYDTGKCYNYTIHLWGERIEHQSWKGNTLEEFKNDINIFEGQWNMARKMLKENKVKIRESLENDNWDDVDEFSGVEDDDDLAAPLEPRGGWGTFVDEFGVNAASLETEKAYGEYTDDMESSIADTMPVYKKGLFGRDSEYYNRDYIDAPNYMDKNGDNAPEEIEWKLTKRVAENEDRRRVTEMARTIKDCNDYKGFTNYQKNKAYNYMKNFLEDIGASDITGSAEKQISGKYWGVEFTLNLAGMGGHAYTIDVMNVVKATIQDQWQGDSFKDFLEDLEDMKNDYMYSDAYMKESKKQNKESLQEATSWNKKFAKLIKERLVGIFRDWVDEDNAQGMVDDFGISVDNPVEELIDEIIDNEYDELHEGRYDDDEYLDQLGVEELEHEDLEATGNEILDEIKSWDIDKKRKVFGERYCKKLEKQFMYVSPMDHPDDVEDDDEDDEYIPEEDGWVLTPEAIERWKEHNRALDKKIRAGLFHWNSMIWGDKWGDDIYSNIGTTSSPSIWLKLNKEGYAKIIKITFPYKSFEPKEETIYETEGVSTPEDIDELFDKFLELNDVYTIE